jgi:MFS family permease
MSSSARLSPRRGALGLSPYQWTVLLAAWLGWGFDVFDGQLFNFVAPNAVPTLLHLTIGSPAARHAVPVWTGAMNSVLLLGWAAGGILFGAIADRIGRTKTLLFTILLYAFGTAACALSPNIWMLFVFRTISGLGIGGEWAAGASLVAEVVPEERRVEAGALLYTSAPMGLFLATFVNKIIAGVFYKGNPEISWRYVLLCGLLPVVFAVLVRLFVREPERWKAVRDQAPARLAELFRPENRAIMISGLIPAVTVLVAWWSCNAFISVFAATLAQQSPGAATMDKSHLQGLVGNWQEIANYSFNTGGLIGTLLTIPAAYRLGRRRMYFVYLILAAAAFFALFGLPLEPKTRLYGFFFLGLTIFGIFGSFTFYLPELFPTRLRATGSGFCYNIGRVIASVGPFVVGAIARNGLPSMMRALFCLGFVPLIGILFLPWVIETRGRPLRE